MTISTLGITFNLGQWWVGRCAGLTIDDTVRGGVVPDPVVRGGVVPDDEQDN
jgi:hypothetical protein